ncbi:uncharacterized protein LOC131072659 [Cryptomeria japonica]|uniref:uncharacterized protein LOC131072659 n=1 Tax=Cryptomeria japonica TaxID=3369 RepID=UPI0027D9DF66|nr:uncharacterized protein LOC131072659 [Cryptomeria japonica]
MEFHSLKLKFGFLCTILVAMGCILEGGCALRVGWSAGMPVAILGKNLERSGITNSFVSSLSKASYEAYNYTQVLNHFGYTPESYQTFPQRYFIDKSNWGGAQSNSPIFVWLVSAVDITHDLDTGIFIDQAPNFKALVVYIEHRYYGTSMPFGGKEAAYANASTKGYFTSTQALAYYATINVDLKKTLKPENCPVVVFGETYGGMLAAWFRLKYAHLTIDALASSAPILHLDDNAPTNSSASIVTKDFRVCSFICYAFIYESWDVIDKIASTPQRLLSLSRLFNSCDCCSKFERRPVLGFESRESHLFRMEFAVFLNPQFCTEMVFPISNPPGTMFRFYRYDLNSQSTECYNVHGVLPRQHWATTEFGGHEITSVLKDFRSNIIFSNGLRDPSSSGGVLVIISESIVPITTEEGRHCEDIKPSASDDPIWLKLQRQKEIMIIQKWINEYKH